MNNISEIQIGLSYNIPDYEWMLRDIYWFQGFFQLSGATTLNEEQVKVIKENIALVLHKVTPSTVGTGTPLKQQ